MLCLSITISDRLALFGRLKIYLHVQNCIPYVTALLKHFNLCHSYFWIYVTGFLLGNTDLQSKLIRIYTWCQKRECFYAVNLVTIFFSSILLQNPIHFILCHYCLHSVWIAFFLFVL